MPLLFTRESKGEKFVAHVPEFFGNELYSDFVGRVHGGAQKNASHFPAVGIRSFAPLKQAQV